MDGFLLKFLAEKAEQISTIFGIDVLNNLEECICYLRFFSPLIEPRSKAIVFIKVHKVRNLDSVLNTY